MDDSDPFFLDWGSSVNVNEDLRRSIQSEINSLDQEIRDLDQSISKEERISSQLRKDYSHAQAELINLRRGASDEKENAGMNEQIQIRLGESLQKELVQVLSTSLRSNSSSSNATACGGDDFNSDQKVEHDADFKTAVTDLPMKEYIEKRIRDVENLKTKIQIKKASLDECRSNFAELQFQLAQTNEHVEQEQKHQSAWNDDIEIIRKEHDTEKQRIKNIKDSLSNSRKNIGDWTQQDAACVSA
jgi:chromosome segregation ATPase